jgi:hypothetical protein
MFHELSVRMKIGARNIAGFTVQGDSLCFDNTLHSVSYRSEHAEEKRDLPEA